MNRGSRNPYEQSLDVDAHRRAGAPSISAGPLDRRAGDAPSCLHVRAERRPGRGEISGLEGGDDPAMLQVGVAGSGLAEHEKRPLLQREDAQPPVHLRDRGVAGQIDLVLVKGCVGEEVGACIDELPVANRLDRLLHQLPEARELDVVERPDRQLGGVQLERETRLVGSSTSWTVSGRTT